MCAPITRVVEFFSQDFLDSFDCVACRFAVSGTDSFDYVKDGHVLKCHWWRGNDMADGVAYAVRDGQLQLLLGAHPVVPNFVFDTCHGDL